MALEVSAYSLKALVGALRPLLSAAGRSSVVALDFDARVAWPAYDWMGVAKAALESLARYLAPGPGARGRPGQSRRGRPRAHHGRQVDPELQGLRGHLG